MRCFVLLPLVALAACSQGGGNGSAAASGVGGGGSAAAPSSGIDVADACATIPRDAVQQIVGTPVKSSELVDVSNDAASGMASSGCVFDFGEARLVQVRLQKLPDGADGTTVQAQARDFRAQAGQAVEDVPGLGQNAFFSSERATQSELVVQIDATRNALITLNRLDVPDPKGKLIAIARRVVG